MEVEEGTQNGGKGDPRSLDGLFSFACFVPQLCPLSLYALLCDGEPTPMDCHWALALPSAFWLACPVGGSSKEGGRHGERSGCLCPPAPACLAAVPVVSLTMARAPVSCPSLCPSRLWSSNDFPLFHCSSPGTSIFLLTSFNFADFLFSKPFWVEFLHMQILGPWLINRLMAQRMFAFLC